MRPEPKGPGWLIQKPSSDKCSRLVEFEEKGEMMKSASICRCNVILGVVLCAFVFWLGGCGYVMKAEKFTVETVAYVLTLGSEPEAYSQLGEAEAEGRRRHLRNERINQQEMMRDIDMVLLFDRPSRLTDRRIP